MLEAQVIEYYTYEDYRQWEGDWELIGGIPLAMAPSSLVTHQKMAAALIWEMMNQTVECEECFVVAEQDWKINEETVVRPDVVFACDDPGEEHLSKAPEIVVEIVSPSSARRDEVTKFELYAIEGVDYYLLGYPEDRKFRLYRLENGRYRKEGDFTGGNYRFEGKHCAFDVDFSRIFSRLKR